MSYPLTASYASPTASTDTVLSESVELPGPNEQSLETTTGRTAYLHALRKGTVRLQAQVNEFLTQRMEEDKAAAAGSTGSTGSAGGVAAISKEEEERQKREEENYGEEVVED